MKKIICILALASVFACQKKEETKADDVTVFGVKVGEDNAKVAAPKVGDDEDLHGCKASAGYTWSELSKECIRVFEKAERYDAANDSAHVKMPAFIVFKDDKAEVFIQTEKAPFIMEKKPGMPIYTKDDWELQILKIENKKGKSEKAGSWLGKNHKILYFQK